MPSPKSQPRGRPDRKMAVPSRSTPAGHRHSRRDEIARTLGQVMQASGAGLPLGDPGTGRRPAELMEAAQQEVLRFQDTLVATRTHLRTHAAIEAAGRLAQGTYGICEGCGQEIPPRRLQAVPLTRFCIACQEVNEQGGRNR